MFKGCDRWFRKEHHASDRTASEALGNQNAAGSTDPESLADASDRDAGDNLNVTSAGESSQDSVRPAGQVYMSMRLPARKGDPTKRTALLCCPNGANSGMKRLFNQVFSTEDFDGFRRCMRDMRTHQCACTIDNNVISVKDSDDTTTGPGPSSSS